MDDVDTTTPVVEQDKSPDLSTRIGGEKGIKPGRPKGAKNKSTLLREALTQDFEEVLKKDFLKVVKVVVEQAKDGCRQSQKLLLDRVVPTVHAESEKEGKNKFTGGITIQIGSLEKSTSVHVSEDIVDVEYTTIEETENGEST